MSVDASLAPAAGKPGVDVIIPAYNAARFIEVTLRSVLRQSHLPRKIIVVDDGSTDNTEQLVRSLDSALIELISVPHGGLSYARNIGIKASVADYVAFLDADDVWLPEKLARQVACLQKHKAKACYSMASSIDEQGRAVANVWEMWGQPHVGEGFFEAMLNCQTFVMGSSSSVMVARQCLLDVGLFDESLAYCEDADMWLRLAQRTAFVYVDAYDVQIRENAHSMTRGADGESRRQFLLAGIRVRNKYAGDHIFTWRCLFRIRVSIVTNLLQSEQGKLSALVSFYERLRDESPDFCRQLGGTSLLHFTILILYSGVLCSAYRCCLRLKRWFKSD